MRLGSEGPGGWSRSYTEQRVERDTVLPSEFFALPPTDPANGLTGYYLAPGIGCWKTTLSGGYLTKTLIAPDPDTPDRVKRASEELRLRPWTEEEARSLGLSLTPGPKPEPDREGPEPRRRLKAMGLKRSNDQELSPLQS